MRFPNSKWGWLLLPDPPRLTVHEMALTRSNRVEPEIKKEKVC